MKTVLPLCFAPIIAISRASTLPKCTGSRLWQCGQRRCVVSPRQVGQLARNLRPSAAKAGGSGAA
jgi:hypothetical protein